MTTPSIQTKMSTLRIGGENVTLHNHYLQSKFHLNAFLKYVHEWPSKSHAQEIIKAETELCGTEIASLYNRLWNKIKGEFSSTVEDTQSLFVIEALMTELCKTDPLLLPNTVAWKIVTDEPTSVRLNTDIEYLYQFDSLHESFNGEDQLTEQYVLLNALYPASGINFFNRILAAFTERSRTIIESLMNDEDNGVDNDSIDFDRAIDHIPEEVREMLTPELRKQLISTADASAPIIWEVSMSTVGDIVSII